MSGTGQTNWKQTGQLLLLFVPLLILSLVLWRCTDNLRLSLAIFGIGVFLIISYFKSYLRCP